LLIRWIRPLRHGGPGLHTLSLPPPGSFLPVLTKKSALKGLKSMLKESKPISPGEIGNIDCKPFGSPQSFCNCELTGRPGKSDYYFVKIQEDASFKKDRHPWHILRNTLNQRKPAHSPRPRFSYTQKREPDPFCFRSDKW